MKEVMKHSSFENLISVLGLALALLRSTTAKADNQAAVYTIDNAAAANHVLVFQHDDRGQITSAGSVATGGAGAGAGLSSQSSVVLSHDGRWLFVCNPGSDDISVLSTGSGVVQLADRVSSGGRMPVSLALHRNLLYVLNAGGAVEDKDNVTGFLFAAGKLIALPGSTRTLSGDNTGPAQVAFTPDGNALIVTERLTSLIDTFTLGDEGLAATHQIFQSSGTTPFGFAVGHNDRIFVSEASGVPGGSSASSYSISESGELQIIDGSVPTQQQAACWLALSHDGRFAYTANAGSGSISGFRVGPQGTLRLLDPSGVTAVLGAGSHPVDIAVTRNGNLLFSLANGNGTLNAFHISSSGSLQSMGYIAGIPLSAAGLAAR
jgi:6-phosphogluconolactonase